MKFIVEHNQGSQGVNERTIYTETIEASDEADAIRKVAGNDASLPPADGGSSGMWVDYWTAYEAEEDWIG